MQTWGILLATIQQALAGRNDSARAALEACWADTAPDDAAMRCVIAHYLADQQDSLEAEIAWDEQALEAFPSIPDDGLAVIGVPCAAGFEPSLRLNLGDGYLRAGRIADARTQVDLARAVARELPPDGYGAMIRGGIERLGERISAS